jgi:hypothetical protein
MAAMVRLVDYLIIKVLRSFGGSFVREVFVREVFGREAFRKWDYSQRGRAVVT